MTWTLFAEGESVEEAATALEDASIAGDDSDGALEQITAVKSAAESVLRSGALGDDVRFQVSAHGHANPSHRKGKGYGLLDHVSIGIRQIARTTPVDPESIEAAKARNLAKR